MKTRMTMLAAALTIAGASGAWAADTPPLNPDWKTGEERRAKADTIAERVVPGLPACANACTSSSRPRPTMASRSPS